MNLKCLAKPVLCTLGGVLISGLIFYYSFVQPKNKTIVSQEKNIATLQKDSIIFNDSITNLIQYNKNNEERIDSFKISLDTTKRDLGYVILASDYALGFQTEWRNAMISNNFKQAELYEKDGFCSSELIEEIRQSYDIDSDNNLQYSFYNKIKVLQGKD